MKKITFLMTFLLVWSFNSNAQYVDEEFEGGTFPPAGWVDEDGALHTANEFGTNNWVQGAPAIVSNGINYGQSAFFDDFVLTQTTDVSDKWLITPAFDLSASVDPELLYSNLVNFTQFVQTNDVFWSEDYTGGDPSVATWNLLTSFTGTEEEDAWEQKGPFPIPSTGTQVYVAFHYVGNNKSEWYVDNVLIRDALTCTPAVGTTTLVEDCANSEFSIDVEITDLGDSGTVTIANDGGEPDVSVTTVPTTVTLGPFTAGTPVNVVLEHDTNSDCDLVFSPAVDACPLPGPANDDFANAIAINCSTTALAGNTDTATIDEDDAPDGFTADLDAQNVWYSYDSAVEGAGDVTVSLCGSDYDTSVLVYTGTSGALTIVAGNDDSETCGAFSVQSEVTFTANGTDIYFIAVEGYDFDDTGDFTMTVTCTASCTPAETNQDCASASALSVNGIATTVDNTCATINAESNTCELFQSIADLWFTFEAPASGQVNIVTALGTATASHLAVYEGSCGALTELSCSIVAASGATLTGLTDGATYYVQLWNNGSEEGTIDITLSDATLSVNNPVANENAFTYFPNPVKNELTLKAQKNIQNVSVYNMLGQEVLRATPNTLESNLNMNELSQGAYFVQVTINDVTETVRILKQ